LSKKKLIDYGILKQQTENDFANLISFSAENGIDKIIVSPLKLVISYSWDTTSSMKPYFDLFRDLNNGVHLKKGTAFRMPWSFYEQLIQEPAQLAASKGMRLVFCKTNLCETV